MTPRDAARFAVKWEHTDAGCWRWTAALDVHGYGRFNLGGMRLAHRVSYEAAVGPIPVGLDLDHLCRNRWCVNPEHLEAVTRSMNLARSPLMGAARSAMTHCKRGHDLVAGDVRRKKDGARVCRECQREMQRASRHARPSEPCSTCGRLLRPWNLADHVRKTHEEITA